MSAYAFALPERLEAREPPEERGLARDQVRLLVARRGQDSIEHERFDGLDRLLDPGDLLVVNVSATIPAAIGARRQTGQPVRLHFAMPAPQLADGWWIVELRTADGSAPVRVIAPEQMTLDGGGVVELVAPYASGARLSLARFGAPGSVVDHLHRHGQPIRYGYVPARWPDRKSVV